MESCFPKTVQSFDIVLQPQRQQQKIEQKNLFLKNNSKKTLLYVLGESISEAGYCAIFPLSKTSFC